MSVHVAQQLSALLSSLHGSLSTAGQTALASIGATIASNPQAAVRALWRLALTEIKNPAVLRSLLTVARPALGALGVGWANIQVASVAITGMTVGALVVEIMFWIAVAVLVIALILLIIWLFYQAVKGLAAFFQFVMSWNPGAGQQPAPMQTPNWGRLLNVLYDPAIGPLNTIEKQVKPTAITA